MGRLEPVIVILLPVRQGFQTFDQQIRCFKANDKTIAPGVIMVPGRKIGNKRLAVKIHRKIKIAFPLHKRGSPSRLRDPFQGQ